MPFFGVSVALLGRAPRQKAPKLTFAGPHSDSEDEHGPVEGWSSSQERANATPKGVNRTQADAMLQAQFEIVREKHVEVAYEKKAWFVELTCGVIRSFNFFLRAKLPWSPSMFKVFVGVSGVYDLPMEAEHLETIGIVPFLSHLSVDGDLTSFSPSLMLQEEIYCKAAGRHPAVHLFHGQADTSVPLEMSTSFARALRKANVPVEVYLQKGATHSEPVVEGPLAGDDIQAQLILPYLLPDRDLRPVLPRAPCFMPRSVLAFAKWVMPF
eukprot:s1201_g19.t1